MDGRGKEGRGREKQRKGRWQGGRDMYWVEECPKNIHVPLDPQSVTLLGRRGFAH